MSGWWLPLGWEGSGTIGKKYMGIMGLTALSGYILVISWLYHAFNFMYFSECYFTIFKKGFNKMNSQRTPDTWSHSENRAIIWNVGNWSPTWEEFQTLLETQRGSSLTRAHELFYTRDNSMISHSSSWPERW